MKLNSCIAFLPLEDKVMLCQYNLLLSKKVKLSVWYNTSKKKKQSSR